MNIDSIDSRQAQIDALKHLIGRLTRPEITLAEARSVREEMSRLLEPGATRPSLDASSLGSPTPGPVA